MTSEQIALRLYTQTIPLPPDPPDDAWPGEIERWEAQIQFRMELERLVMQGPSDHSREWAAEFSARDGFSHFARRREWIVFQRLLAGDVESALDQIADQWRGPVSSEDRLLG